jgi:hypothetical protein
MKLSISGKLQTVLSTMRYKMAYSEFAGKMMRRFTIASEDFLQYLEAWVHGGPEPARRTSCLIQNIPICFLNAHRKSMNATYFIHEVTAETSEAIPQLQGRRSQLDGIVIENTERPQRPLNSITIRVIDPRIQIPYRPGASTSNLKGFPATSGITNSLTEYKSPFHCFLHSALTKAH